MNWLERAPCDVPTPRRDPQATTAAAAVTGAVDAARAAGAVAVLVLADIAAGARLWGYSRFVLGRFTLRGQPGLRFFKVLGAGRHGGFGLRPSASHLGLFLVFDGDAAARRFLAESAVMQAWRARAAELFSVRLRAFSSRGSWAGTALPVSAAPPPPDAPVAALTRASIRPLRAAAFWRHAPPTEQSLADAPGCLLAAGVGEAPLLRQATFSLWSSVRQLEAYAKTGAHLAAARAAQAEGYFSESMFVRFTAVDPRGVWRGHRHG